MEPDEVLTAYTGAFLDALASAGVGHIAFSPGSRSTPLILTAARRGSFRLWRHLDERSAGFFALGLAKALDEPVALLCSSGTAAANFYPAVIEAYYDRVPLVVLTADRPHELRDVGAPQAIDQVHLYGSHVKWFVDMPLPEGTDAAQAHARTVAFRAVAEAKKAPAGPVHLNFPFREPLLPAEHAPAPRDLVNVGAVAGPLRPAAGERTVSLLEGTRVLTEDELAPLADLLASYRRGLIICGPQRDPGLAGGVVRLARSLGFPVLADPLSGVRYGKHDRTWVIDAYDALLRDETFAAGHEPDVVVRFGAAPTSKALNLFLARCHRARHVVIDEGGGWRDPLHVAGYMVYADPVQTAHALCDAMPGDLRHADRSWGRAWIEANDIAKEAVQQEIASFDELFEGRIFPELAHVLPDGATLYVGNSMPVRDLDSFLPSSGATWRCLANRGANGIDGVVSSSLGVSASGAGPVVLVIGDLSFYHDLGGLLAAKTYGLDLTVVLVHNDGGGIFSFLPQAGVPEHFEDLFGTPHGLDFAPAVAMYGGSFTRVRTWDEFRRSVRRGLAEGGLHVVEVPTGREANVRMHRAVWQAVKRALAEGGAGYG